LFQFNAMEAVISFHETVGYAVGFLIQLAVDAIFHPAVAGAGGEPHYGEGVRARILEVGFAKKLVFGGTWI